MSRAPTKMAQVYNLFSKGGVRPYPIRETSLFGSSFSRFFQLTDTVKETE